MNYIDPINQSEIAESNSDVIDVVDDTQEYINLIKENLSYDFHMEYDQNNDRKIYDELFQIICDIVCVKRKTVKIAGEDYPYELLNSVFPTSRIRFSRLLEVRFSDFLKSVFPTS